MALKKKTCAGDVLVALQVASVEEYLNNESEEEDTCLLVLSNSSLRDSLAVQRYPSGYKHVSPTAKENGKDR